MSNNPKRILIVDDVEDIRNMLRNHLEDINFEVETAADGFEALSKLVLDVDLVLLDVEMPTMDGFDIASC